ncbi:MAG TPA: J domain-containing protein [Vicinamibacterales bacterium]
MDFYIVLGVPREATLADVKRAYRRLARRYHPDINPGDDTAAAVFRRVAEAYEILSDPHRRRQYDATGAARPAGETGPSIEFEGFDFTTMAEGREAGTFSELFAEMFQPPPAPGQPRPGAEVHVELPLTFAQAMRGGEFPVSVLRQERCADCDGSGMRRRAETRCARCQGTGTVRWARGHMVFTKNCVGCGGTGRLRQQPCASCGALGVQPRTETIVVPVAPGATDGQAVRMPRKGHAGVGGAAHGDLFVRIRVAPHQGFRRDGLDLHLTVPIAVHEAALGARIDVPALDGTARLKVPAGTQSGQRFRLRGRGIPSASGESGDLVVEVKLVLPPALDERSKSLLEEFGRLNPADVRKDLFS